MTRLDCATCIGGSGQLDTRNVVGFAAMTLEDDGKIHKHRRQIDKQSIPFNLFVARFVGRWEIARSPVAQATMKKASERLPSTHVWDEYCPPEWGTVREAGTTDGYTVRMGYLFAMCLDKSSELEEQLRTYKG